MDSEIRVALVTGAGRGIGKAISRRLGEDGLAIAVNDIDADSASNTASELSAAGYPSIAVPADVGDRAAVGKMVEQVVGEFGRLDVLVANAGIVQVKRLLDVSTSDLENIFRVNVYGYLNCLQAAAESMLASDHGGKIIAASSIAGRQGFEFMGHYSATKFAIIGLTQAAAKELAQHRITVNAYCPGMVNTDMAGVIDRGIGEYLGLPEGAAVAEFSKMIALGRLEEPDDVAGLVSFLASSDSDYMTGQTVAIDGGITF